MRAWGRSRGSVRFPRVFSPTTFGSIVDDPARLRLLKRAMQIACASPAR
jgi:hypothetical protein